MHARYSKVFVALASDDAKRIARWVAVALAVVAGAALALAGCYDLGPDKTEPAVVVQTSYTPPTSGTGVGFSGGKMVVTDNSTDEVYAVVFRCQHGNFAIHGSDRNTKEIWARLAVGDQVRVTYAEKVHDGEVRGFRFRSVEKVRP